MSPAVVETTILLGTFIFTFIFCWIIAVIGDFIAVGLLTVYAWKMYTG